MTRERAQTLADFRRIAAAFAATLRPGDAVGLEGDLGSGKTTFIRAAVAALQGVDPVSSPTFTFRHRYPGPPPVDHLDLFRLERPSEAVELGLDEAFSADAIAFVEWPERLPRLLPPDAVRVTIRGSGDAPRDITIERA